MTILGLDPGPTASALVVYDAVQRRVLRSAMLENAEMLDWLSPSHEDDLIDISDSARDFKLSLAILSGRRPLVIEKIESMGMAVGASTFETVWWSGRFAQAYPWEFHRVTRREVKLHLCGSMRAKDGNVRQALLDRFGGESAQGKKAWPGPLYGIASHQWSALAVAVTFHETEALKPKEARP